MKKISAEIVADSVDPRGNRITSFLLTYPRFIHGEVMTHRMFSRNSASSRAIPFEKMVKMVKEDPFIPIAWQKDHKGMQGSEYETHLEHIKLNEIEWLEARDSAIEHAKVLNTKGEITKQLCNRLLDPYMWHTVLVTATEFENFFDLRCPKYYFEPSNEYFRSKKDFLKKWNSTFKVGVDISEETTEDSWTVEQWHTLFNISQAEIHIQALAEDMWDKMNESAPRLLEPGQWHIPFGDNMFSEDITKDYKTTKISDLDFHKRRIMFIIKDGEVITAPQGTSKSHTEYFGDVTGLIRGFRWNNNVYTYKNGFIPVESEEVKHHFNGLNLYAGGKDFFHYKYGDDPKIKISTARCARLSYMTFDGEIDYEKDIKLHNRLLKSRHSSPFEHCARVMDTKEYNRFTKGYNFSAICASDVEPNNLTDAFGNDAKGWCNNLRGFIPYRYLIENDYD